MPRLLPDIFLTDSFTPLIEYAIFAVLLFRAYSVSFLSGKTFNLSVLVVAFYAMTDELHQNFAASREPDILDVFADISGELIGASEQAC